MVAEYTEFEFEYDGLMTKRNAALDRKLMADQARNEKIVKRAHREAERGESILILANRKALCEKLGKMLAERGVVAPVLTSRTKSVERHTAIHQLREGEISILIATSLADEGLDVPRLSRILLAWPERAQGRTTQRVGRLMRPYKGKNPILYDYVDGDVEVLRDRWMQRRRVYNRLGLDVKS